MYTFVAYYTNMITEREIKRKIQFNGQHFENERACYFYAIEKAYDMKELEENLDRLEFISC